MATEPEVYSANIDDYQVYGRIGKGAFAEVYKAYCNTADKLVAIKVIELEVEDSHEDIFAKVMNESTVMLQLSHVNIVSSLKTFTHDSEVWIVMPMLVASCADILKNSYPDGFDDERWIARIFVDVVSGLEYIHKQNMVHRDLKSGNILLDENGVARIADFGVSGSLVQELTAKKRLTVTGTPCWMAPEVAEHAAGHDSKADIWSLGITCLELIRGKPPYHAYTAVKAMMKILNDDPPSVERFVKKSTTRQFRLFVESCLQKDPKRRKTAKELKTSAFLQNPMDCEELVESLSLGEEENPYQQNVVNSSQLPHSLMRRPEDEAPTNNTTWVFTGDHKADLRSMIQQVQDEKANLKPGQFLEAHDGADSWLLARVVRNEANRLEIMLQNQSTIWEQFSNVRSSKMEDVFTTCQLRFEEFSKSGWTINDEAFRGYLFQIGLEDELVNAAMRSDRTQKEINALLTNFIMWSVNNSSASQPASAVPSRFEVLPDSGDDEPTN